MTVTDATTATASASVVITQPAALVTTLSQTKPTAGANNGSASVSVSGGTAGYTYSWAPSGGTAATATGLAAGTYTVTVTDANTCQTTQTFSLTNQVPVALSPSVLPAPAVNAAYSQAIVASGGVPPYGYSVTSGSLPAGLSLSSTGLLSGTPTAAGAYAFTVTATDSSTGSGPLSASLAYSGTVAAGGAGQIYNGALPLAGGGGGGSAMVVISGASAGCSVDASATNFSATVPPNAPAGASFPQGVFRLRSTGCALDTLTVSITYPQPFSAGVTFQKYGPATGGATPTWFPLGTLTGNTVTYQVTDNGIGDSDATPGVIEDPFAPILLAAVPGGVASIPTLSEWGLALMSLLLGGLAWRRQRGLAARG